MNGTGTRTLFRNGRVYAGPPSRRPTALAVEDGRVLWTGDEDRAEAYDAGDVVDLAGAWLAPAFVDAHVHTVQAGFRLTELDLSGTRSLTEALDRLTDHAAGRPHDAVIVGQGWDETTWPERRVPTGDELAQAAGGRRVYLSRVDGHSSVVSPALADAVSGLAGADGWSPDGRAERDAHHAIRAVLADLVGPGERLSAARAACREMAAHGIVGFHENAAPHIGPDYELDLVQRAAAEVGLRPTLYWGELLAVEKARDLGVQGLCGDLVADGALGSRTAALHEEYADQPGHHGHAYLTAEQIAEHLVACTEAGLQAGFHGIGDAALDAVAAGLEAAEAKLGAEVLSGARHRLEHVEMPSRQLVQLMARLGVTASVQPVFDALWGGPDLMYAARLGGRWRATNPLLELEMAGVPLAFGSDSPVTPIGPWHAVRAALHHHNPDHRLPAAFAFRAHTRGGWSAAGDHEAGHLSVGSRADLAVWETPAGLGEDGLPDLSPEAGLPSLVRTVSAGRTIHPVES